MATPPLRAFINSSWTSASFLLIWGLHRFKLYARLAWVFSVITSPSRYVPSGGGEQKKGEGAQSVFEDGKINQPRTTPRLQYMFPFAEKETCARTKRAKRAPSKRSEKKYGKKKKKRRSDYETRKVINSERSHVSAGTLIIFCFFVTEEALLAMSRAQGATLFHHEGN